MKTFAIRVKIKTLKPTTTHTVISELCDALDAILRRDQRNTCQHEETYRGGAIWEICHACGARWADDRGGRPEWKEPVEWTKAYTALETAARLQHEEV